VYNQSCELNNALLEQMYIFCEFCPRTGIGLNKQQRVVVTRELVIGWVSLIDGRPICDFWLNKRFFVALLDVVFVLHHTVSESMEFVVSNNVQYELAEMGVPFVNRVQNITMNGKPYEEWPDRLHIAINSVSE
jgi:hypothetical protein